MKQSILLQSTEDLISIIREEIQKGIQPLLKKEPEEMLLSPREASLMFRPQVTTRTLNRWVNEGRIPQHKLGGRVFFKSSELINSLETVKKYKRI